MNEDKAFKTFCLICYLLAGISLLCFLYISAFGVPNFSNVDEQRSFCRNQAGTPIEPSRDYYNEMLCVFRYNSTMVKYVSSEITNEGWAEYFGREVGDYCFSCWDSDDCASPHNDVLREMEVHC